MGQEYWVHFKDGTKKVKAYLKSRGFPVDEHDKKTLIIASEKEQVDCWLSWHGQRLEIASQVFDDQSAWCAAIALRLDQLFGVDKTGADSTGWWKNQRIPNKPFAFSMRIFKKRTLEQYKKRQKSFIAEAKRLLP